MNASVIVILGLLPDWRILSILEDQHYEYGISKFKIDELWETFKSLGPSERKDREPVIRKLIKNMKVGKTKSKKFSATPHQAPTELYL